MLFRSKIDARLVALVNERAELAMKLAQAKSDDDYDPAREQEVLERVVAVSRGPIDAASLRSIFREVISGTRSLVRRRQVAYLGPEYTYTHLAALERFGHSAELVPVTSIPAVFEEVHGGQTDYGVVPIENSTDGRIVDTLDMFTRLRVNICGEVKMSIHHCLLGQGPRSAVRQVYSKPQALSQCRNWLARHLPGAETIEVPSTAAAAQTARDRPTAAAIASRQAGVACGLDVLAANIEDNATNLTRFAVIGHESAARTGRDKTALMFGIEHRPGGLAEAMTIFKRNRLNLTWIESFPIPPPEDGYLFFVEFEGHQSELRARRAIESLGKKATRLEVLGSYAMTEVVG